MSYPYYQQSGTPGWGTSQFRFGAPPTPSFQPQPSWSGMDYYRAHAGSANADPSLFDQAWNSARDYRDPYTQDDGMGVGIHEARHWHRRAYGGMGELSQMSPIEIGHAAAYEAYRTWIYNTSVSEPLSGDIERQREALIGMAVAEASRLLSQSQHAMNNYGSMEASRAAAMTASIIFYWSREHDDGDSFRGRTRSRRGSLSDYEDAYADDYDRMYPGQYRSQSHHRSHSRHRSRSRPPPGMMPSLVGQPQTAPMQGMMSNDMYGSYGMSPGMSPNGMSPNGYANPYPTPYGGGSTMQYGMPGMQTQGAMPGQYTPGYTPTSAITPGYAGSNPMDPYQRHSGISPTYAGSSAMDPYQRQGTAMSVPYPNTQQLQYPQTQFVQPQYAQQYYMQPNSQQYLPQQGMIVVQPHKRHRHHRSKSRGSKSSEVQYISY